MAVEPKKPLYDPAANPYPKMVYPGEPAPGAGKIVNSADEEAAYLESLKPKEAEKVKEDDKDVLLAEAESLGLKIDKRSSIDKIKAAIAEKKAD